MAWPTPLKLFGSGFDKGIQRFGHVAISHLNIHEMCVEEYIFIFPAKPSLFPDFISLYLNLFSVLIPNLWAYICNGFESWLLKYFFALLYIGMFLLIFVIFFSFSVNLIWTRIKDIQITLLPSSSFKKKNNAVDNFFFFNCTKELMAINTFYYGLVKSEVRNWNCLETKHNLEENSQKMKIAWKKN